MKKPRSAPKRVSLLGLWLVRLLLGTLELFLRLFVLNRKLPAVKARLADVSYGESRKQRLDIVVPEGTGPFPVLVYVHGGAWVSGDKSNFRWITHSLAHGGVLVFSINYRWAPEASFREQISDVAQAIAFAREHAREHGGDPDRLFLAGDSAGAHLVCWLHVAQVWPQLLTTASPAPAKLSPALKGSILLYGMFDLAKTWQLGRSVRTPIRALLGGATPSDRPDLTALASPHRLVAPGIAPVMVCVGEKDPLRAQSVALVESLAREKVPHRSVVLERAAYPDAGHSFINFGVRKASQAALREALAFIADPVGPAPKSKLKK
ncbi:MAG TPA: alpha/beta hydrolase [Myxococcales bacterium]